MRAFLKTGTSSMAFALAFFAGFFSTRTHAQVLYKPLATEIAAPDQESYTGYSNTKSNLVNETSITSVTNTVTNGTTAMLWSDNSDYFGSSTDYDPLHNNVTINPTTALNGVTGIDLWAPGFAFPTYGDGPIKDFTVTVTYSGGTWTSGMFTTAQPTTSDLQTDGQYFGFPQSFDGVTSIAINTSDGWYNLATKYNKVAGATSGWVSAASVEAQGPAWSGSSLVEAQKNYLYGYNMSLNELRVVQNGTLVVPEPSSMMLVLLPLSVMGLRRRRR